MNLFTQQVVTAVKNRHKKQLKNNFKEGFLNIPTSEKAETKVFSFHYISFRALEIVHAL